MIRLATAEIVPFGGELARAVGVASRSRRSLLVRLTDDSGECGFGEACPLEERSLRAPIAAALDALARSALPSSLNEIAAFGETLVDGSVRFAIESALTDIAARRERITLARLLSDGAVTEDARVSKLVGALDEPALLERVSSAITEGFEVIKVKGRGQAAELATFAALGARFGGRVAMRLDLNGAFEDPSAARAYLERAGPLEACEDPVSMPRMLDSMAWPCDVLVDAGLEDPAFAERALAAPTIAGLTLKPQVLGLFRSLALSREATRRGKQTVVTHALEGPWALAAARELALATGARCRAHGLAPHAALDLYPPMKLPRSARGPSFLSADSDALGLGVGSP